MIRLNVSVLLKCYSGIVKKKRAGPKEKVKNVGAALVVFDPVVHFALSFCKSRLHV